MAKGGARNRSGPQPVEGSRSSDRKGFVLSALPPEGFSGEVPEFPLPGASSRELELWVWAWGTPQACAWSEQSWRWYVVAQWVRWSVKAEDSEASAAVVAAVIRFADQIGLTPAGLKENGWKVAEAPTPASDDEPTEDDASVTDLAEWLAGGA